MEKQLLCQLAPTTIYLKDAEGRVIDCNDHFETHTGLRLQDIRGKKVGEFVDDEDLREFLANKDREMLDNPQPQKFDIQARHESGVIVDAEFRQKPVVDENGELIGIVGVVHDVSDQKKAERSMQSALRVNRNIVSAISSILIGVDALDRITHWNKEATRYFGGKAEERIGQIFSDLPFTWDWSRVRPAVLRCLETKKPATVRDLRYVRPDGKEGFVSLQLNPFNCHNCGFGYLILAEEITQYKVLEAQAIQSQKLESVGYLASGVAHEINTPAQYIGDNIRFMHQAYKSMYPLLRQHLVLLEQIKADAVDPQLVKKIEHMRDEIDVDYLYDEIPRALKESLEGVERIAGIVQAMKEFSHPGLDKKSAVSLRQEIESTLTVTRNIWRGVAEVSTSFDPAMPAIPIFPGEFNQAVLNIIVNAVHAIQDAHRGGDPGRIVLETEWKDGWAILRIRDNGPGIPDEIRSNVFDPFFTTKPVGKGTGQGLAIAHSIIVDKHRGRLRFESEAGKGTVFIIELPTEQAIDDYSF